jgi:branched-chain amino acid aminotransferase
MVFSDRDGFIWMDGDLVDWRDAKVHFLTSSLHYGTGVFEGIRAYKTTSSGTCIFRLEDHISRLFNSAKILHIDIPYTKQEICDAHHKVINANKLDDAYIRPLVFLGSEGMGLRAEGLKVHVGIAAWGWPSYMSPQALEAGIKVRTSSYTRHHVNITMCKAKASGNYINSVLALREAQNSGCEEAIMLDPEGYVAEGTGENFFMVKSGVIYTPELTSCLDGITRHTVVHLAQEHGIEVREKRISRDEVYVSDEAFFTGTAAEVVPIQEYDDRTIGSGCRGPVTELLQSAYFDLVRGKSSTCQEWLTPVQGD